METVIFESMSEAKKVIKHGKIIILRAGDFRFAMTRINERLFAFQTNCPHFDHPLEDGKVTPNFQVVCPWHNYIFNMKSGVEYEARCKPMEVYQIKITPDQKIVMIT